MRYQIKQHPEDFIVREVVDETIFCGSDEQENQVLFLLITKRALTTMDVVEYGLRMRGCSRKDIGIAGLKDKKAVTTQWISFASTLVQRIGKKTIISDLKQMVKVEQIRGGKEMLTVGRNMGNKFEIIGRLKGDDTSKDIENVHILANIDACNKYGIVNFFGKQRFGKKNVKRILDILEHGSWKEEHQYITRMLLQAYPSWVFNQYCDQRKQWEQETGEKYMIGDIMINQSSPDGIQVGIRDGSQINCLDYIKAKQLCSKGKAIDEVLTGEVLSDIDGWMIAGPMIGKELVLPPVGSEARGFEEVFLSEIGWDEEKQNFCEKYQLWGYRRPYRVKVGDLQYAWLDDRLLKLKFSLPTGSYATVAVEEIIGTL